MKRCAATLGILAATLVAAPAAAPAATRSCGPAEARTVAANRWVRVYLDEDYHACSVESRKSMLLAHVASSSSGFLDADQFTLAGRHVAYLIIDCPGLGGGPCGESLNVVDMGRLRFTMGHGFRQNEDLGSIVLKANGSIAFTYLRVVDPATRRTEVILRRRDRRGRAVLASGFDDQAPRDLRLVGSTLHWLQGGAERTKTLR